ncbi:PKD domain-containing protein [Lacihabitans soyangensis]|uniref:mannan endo-1,4-beta-mannosidase n=1 Tax=Lacihabitans soyangensis TaxID=869394 RepID=A0AAE3H6C2_9BACT|nr:PKD domain-containing protein [Lacihabitans soyangensis]MCP9765688.1 PKD domain-containing protein [Lacihabitans soyangensis]
MKIKDLFSVLLFFSFLGGNAQVIADFETASQTPIIAFGTEAKVVDNPDTMGNKSKKVLYYKKEVGSWKFVGLTFPAKHFIGKNDVLSFKIRSSTKGRVYPKVWLGSMVVVENWAFEYNFQPEPNNWTECKLDISKVPNVNFDKIEIAASVDNDALAADVYIDDIRLYNSASPNGEPIISFIASTTKVQVNQTIDFDASGSFDIDGGALTFIWDFQDGTSKSNVVKTSHVFLEEGIFDVELTVINQKGVSIKKRIKIYVFANNKLISKLLLSAKKANTNEKIVGEFVLFNDYENPYDPDEVSVDAIIFLPDGKELIVPCFYYIRGYFQGNDWKVDSTQQNWMLRFSSSQIGNHEIILKLTDKSGISFSGVQRVDLLKGSTKGIIGIDSNDKQALRHQSGEMYTPLGINIAWNNTSTYTNLIKSLSQSNANFVRYWQVPFNKQALEWRKDGYTGGIGFYSQQAAAMQDSILNLSEATDMRLQLTLFQHGMFSETVNSNWSDNPYNIAIGGPLGKSEEFFYNETAKKSTKKLIRYIIARWGYSPNVFAWELFNEVQFTGSHPNQSLVWKTAIIDWHEEMTKYIKSLDSFNHIVTSSADDAQCLELDKHTNLDIVQYHVYNSKLLSTQNSKDLNFKEKLTKTGVINGEYGEDIINADVPFEKQRIAIWTGILSRVPHIMWLWNNYPSNPEWAKLFEIPAAFIKNKDFVKDGLVRDWNPIVSEGSLTLATVGLSTANKNYFAILYDEQLQNNITGAVLNLTSIPQGSYKIGYTNTLTGKSTEITSYAAVGINRLLKLPTFSKSLIVSISYIGDVITPVAIAEINTTIIGQGKSITLTGENSYNPDTTMILEYLWNITEKPSASKVSIENLKTQVLILDKAGRYTFVLSVKNGSKVSNVDTVEVYANSTPIANIGKDLESNLGQTIFFDPTLSSDLEKDLLTYKWSLIQSPPKSIKQFITTNPLKPSLFIDEYGEYLISMVVSDPYSSSVPDTIKVSVKEIITFTEPILLDNKFSVYPNPTNNDIIIDFKSNKEPQLCYELLDISGKSLFKGLLVVSPNQLNKLRISLKEIHLQTGIYLLRLFNIDTHFQHKIVFLD